MIRLGIQVFTFVFIGTGVILLGLSQRDKFTQHSGVTKPNNTEVIDLGVIHAFRTPQIVRTIPVGNYGTEPIRIKGSAVSCGCTIASIKKSELKPGETVDLEVDIKMPFVLSSSSVLVSVKTDDIQVPERNFELRYCSLPRIHPNKESLDIGTTSTKESAQLTGNFRVQRFYLPDESEDIGLYAVASNKDLLVEVKKAKSSLSTFGALTNEWTVNVQLSKAGSRRVGRRNERIELKTDDNDLIQIPVNWEVLSSREISPRAIGFGSCKQTDKPIRKVIQLKSQPNSHLRVRSIDKDMFVKVVAQNHENSIQTYEVVFDPSKSEVKGPQSGPIVFRFEDGEIVECEWFASIETE